MFDSTGVTSMVVDFLYMLICFFSYSIKIQNKIKLEFSVENCAK